MVWLGSSGVLVTVLLATASSLTTVVEGFYVIALSSRRTLSGPHESVRGKTLPLVLSRQVSSLFISNSVPQENENDSECQQMDEFSPELWLDLRETAIVPRVAIDLLSGDLSADELGIPSNKKHFIVDRVLISEDASGRALRHTQDGDPEIFVVRQSDGAIVSIEDPSVTYGGTISVEENKMADPIKAIDTVLQGGWLVLDSGELTNDSERQEALDSVVTLISGSVQSGGPALLGINSDDPELNNNMNTVGGVAMTCSLHEHIFSSLALMQKLKSGSFIQSTENGILLPTYPSVTGVSSSEDDFSGNVQCALVLPFDVSLWKAASLIFATS